MAGASVHGPNKSPALKEPGSFYLNRYLYRPKYDFISFSFSTDPGTIRDFTLKKLQGQWVFNQLLDHPL
jgi:hypothetical protein